MPCVYMRVINYLPTITVWKFAVDRGSLFRDRREISQVFFFFFSMEYFYQVEEE